MLQFLRATNVGPSLQSEMELKPRLNLMTGFNCRGKTFYLDLAWWALTRVWAREQPFPSKGSRDGQICFATTDMPHDAATFVSHFNRDTWLWSDEHIPPTAGLVLYAQDAEVFSIWDPLRHLNEKGANQDHPAHFLDRNHVWSGDAYCAGFQRDLADWKKNDDIRFFENLSRALIPEPSWQKQIEEEGIITMESRYVRLIGMSYLLVWSWRQHLAAAKRLGRPPVTRITFLIDAVDAELEFSWRKLLVPILLKLVDVLSAETGCSVQVLAGTRAPYLAASVAPHFKPESDFLFSFGLEIPDTKPPTTTSAAEFKTTVEDTIPVPAWVVSLLESPLYVARCNRYSIVRLENHKVRDMLAYMAWHGGRATIPEIERILKVSLIQVNGFIAILARLLNPDGYLALRREGCLVILEQAILLTQFQIEARAVTETEPELPWSGEVRLLDEGFGCFSKKTRDLLAKQGAGDVRDLVELWRMGWFFGGKRPFEEVRSFIAPNLDRLLAELGRTEAFEERQKCAFADLECSNRTRNALVKLGVVSAADLVALWRRNPALEMAYHVGAKSHREIAELMNRLIFEDSKSLMDQPLASFGLAVRTENALRKAGLVTGRLLLDAWSEGQIFEAKWKAHLMHVAAFVATNFTAILQANDRRVKHLLQRPLGALGLSNQILSSLADLQLATLGDLVKCWVADQKLSEARGLGARSHVAILRVINQVLFAPTRAQAAELKEPDTARRRILGAALDRLRAQPGHEMPLLDLVMALCEKGDSIKSVRDYLNRASFLEKVDQHGGRKSIRLLSQDVNVN